MKLSRVQIAYLLTIYEMLERGPVRLADVAQVMGVSKPSVHGMEEQLIRLGLLEKKRYSSVQMTESGREKARCYGEAVEILTSYFQSTLQLSAEIAGQSAFALLGEWTEETRQAAMDQLRQEKGLISSGCS